MKRRAPTPIAEILDAVTRELQPPSLLAEVQRCWDSAVGETIASWGAPVSERAGVITIGCDDSMVAHELEMMKLDVIERLSMTLGDARITDLKFRVL